MPHIPQYKWLARVYYSTSSSSWSISESLGSNPAQQTCTHNPVNLWCFNLVTETRTMTTSFDNYINVRSPTAHLHSGHLQNNSKLTRKNVLDDFQPFRFICPNRVVQGIYFYKFDLRKNTFGTHIQYICKNLWRSSCNHYIWLSN